MKTLKNLIFAAILLLSSCAISPDSPNPLDRPQTPVLTVEQMHGQNVAAITGDPTKNQTIEIE